jgi:hypothetical protein
MEIGQRLAKVQKSPLERAFWTSFQHSSTSLSTEDVDKRAERLRSNGLDHVHEFPLSYAS